MVSTRQKIVLGLVFLAMIADLTGAATVQVSPCDGYTSPANCKKGVNCLFEASWFVYEAGAPPSDPNGNKTQAAVFTITIRRPTEKSSSFYTGIGFSDHQAMPDTDVVLGYAYNNNFLEVVDAYIEPGQIKAPTIDQRQDTFNGNGSLVDDPNDKNKRILSFSFTRRLDTGDSKDLSLTQCRYFFFVTSGGTAAGPRQFYKHDATPDMSTEKICLTTCLAAGKSAATTTTTKGPGSSTGRSNLSWVIFLASAFWLVLKR